MIVDLILAAQEAKFGKLIAYPTESVYGLGCDPMNNNSVSRLLALKNRELRHGLILIGGEFQHILPYVDESKIPATLIDEILQSWPGPTTWIMPCSKRTPRWIMGNHMGVAVRVTAHKIAAQLCVVFGGALVSTSANPHGLPPARCALDVVRYFNDPLFVVDAPTGEQLNPTMIRDALTGVVIRS